MKKTELVLFIMTFILSLWLAGASLIEMYKYPESPLISGLFMGLSLFVAANSGIYYLASKNEFKEVKM